MSEEYLSEAPWDDLFDRMQQVYDQETEIPLPDVFNGHSPCRVSHVREDTRGNKQICFTWNGVKRHIMVHVLSFITYNEMRISTGSKLQVSHLCHNHQCHEPSHLVLEDSQKNQSRKNCVGYIWSHRYEDWIPVCNHTPRCLTARINNPN